MQNEWIENTGTVPECVGPDTPIEVEYRSGIQTELVRGGENNHPFLWEILANDLDVIRWRFLK